MSINKLAKEYADTYEMISDLNDRKRENKGLSKSEQERLSELKKEADQIQLKLQNAGT